MLPATTEDDDMDELVNLVVALSVRVDKMPDLQSDLKHALEARNKYKNWGDKMSEMLKEAGITPPNHWSFSGER